MTPLDRKRATLESILKHHYRNGRTTVDMHMSRDALKELGATDYGNRLEFQIHVDGAWRTMALIAGTDK